MTRLSSTTEYNRLAGAYYLANPKKLCGPEIKPTVANRKRAGREGD